ncbi:MAG: LLM class flavin-dependent oxidoreductase [Deltaproteobacteria bacterium]|nr:LLM class flavin-dependent oxidoreductase [Deltaproteobacteria bacterium]
MLFDVFFSISQTPVRGRLPSEAEMFRNFFAQVEAADALGYGTAWVAEAHLSTAVQKRHAQPVVPHWQGEIGLNTDILQLAHLVFARTRRIGVGSAVANLLVNGGPVAHAERVAAFCALHGVDPAEQRRLRFGFAAGRFDFMARAFGVKPRDALEAAAWPALKGRVFAEATEIFLRLLKGEALAGADVAAPVLGPEAFRSPADWAAVEAEAAKAGRLVDGRAHFAHRYDFDVLRIVPREWRRELLELYLGSHEPALQEAANQHLPVRVFNLSITAPTVIEDTHRRMAAALHPDGGPWTRACMPRTVMVFLNQQPGLDAAARKARAQEEAQAALGAYWTALEGTLDPRKVAAATDNAVIGDADDVAAQLVARFHPDDRLMLWFDFFNHDCGRVIDDMRAFVDEVIPRVQARLGAG